MNNDIIIFLKCFT